MMTEIINKNIRFLRAQAGWTQKELAARLDVNQPVIGAYEEQRALPPLPIILKLANLFKLDLDTLIKTNLATTKNKLKKEKLVRSKDVLSITVDRDEKENVELVTQKASAGYLNGYADLEFVKELPKISIPSLTKSATHRAFEIKGDSMLPVKPGDIIIGRYVENFEKVKDGKTYIVVSETEGIVYKRIYAFIEEEKILLISDNRNYKPYLLNMRDITEMWAFTARVTMDDVVVEPTENVSLDFLASQWMEKLSE
jgi:transcriptional regulator with XRE-family HTH domain